MLVVVFVEVVFVPVVLGLAGAPLLGVAVAEPAGLGTSASRTVREVAAGRVSFSAPAILTRTP